MRRVNAVLSIAIVLPLIAVLGSFLTLGVAMLHPDSELPEQYHWEGMKLERDFERAGRAAALGVEAVLDGFGSEGACNLKLTMRGLAPSSLTLRMIHATQPSLDQLVRLSRTAARSLETLTHADYAGECRAAPRGHWRIELADAENHWSIRQTVRGPLSRARLEAGSPRGS